MSQEAAKRRKTDDNRIINEVNTGVLIDMFEQMKNDMTRQMVLLKTDSDRKISKMQDEIDSLKTQKKSMEEDIKIMQDGQVDSDNWMCEMQEEIDILKSDREEVVVSKIDDWEYPLSIDIPANYWIEQGFNDAYSRAVKSFLWMIKHLTCCMRRGLYIQSIELVASFENESENTILIHDDILVPHLKQLIDALGEYDYPGAPENMFLTDIQLVPEVIDMLTQALAATKVKNVYIKGTDFVQVCHQVNFVTKIMQDNSRMRVFRWKGNPIYTIQHANDLVGAITNHPHLKAIDMSNCFTQGNHGHETLCRLLSGDKYEKVRFHNNNIITLGSTHIPDYIATNPPLTILNLKSNHLDDSDARLIARALKQNTKLKILCLGGNDITEVGINALKRSIFDPSSTLNSAAISNHTCLIKGVGLEKYFYDKAATEREIRGKKIYSLLSKRSIESSNAYHLDLELGEDGLKLAPRVLSCVNRYKKRYIDWQQGYFGQSYRYISSWPEDVNFKPLIRPVAIVYDILRNWRMPELYERKCSKKSRENITGNGRM